MTFDGSVIFMTLSPVEASNRHNRQLDWSDDMLLVYTTLCENTLPPSQLIFIFLYSNKKFPLLKLKINSRPQATLLDDTLFF